MLRYARETSAAKTWRLVPTLVTTGLDPVFHAEFPQMLISGPMRSMDCRVKPGNDERGGLRAFAPYGLPPSCSANRTSVLR
jgi:hypothetical protein